MNAFDNARIELARRGWEVEISSVAKKSNRKGIHFEGHCIEVTNVISMPSQNHHNHAYAEFNTLEDAVKTIEALASAVLPLESEIGLAANLKLYPLDDMVKIEKREAVLEDGMTYLQVYDEMIHAGWEYFDEMFSPNPDLLVRTAQFSAARWNGKKLRPPLTLVTRSTKLDDNWDERVLQLARQAPLFGDKRELLNRASAY